MLVMATVPQINGGGRDMQVVNKCPECGSNPALIGPPTLAGNQIRYYVRCSKCDFRGPRVEIPGGGPHAIELWNRIVVKSCSKQK